MISWLDALTFMVMFSSCVGFGLALCVTYVIARAK